MNGASAQKTGSRWMLLYYVHPAVATRFTFLLILLIGRHSTTNQRPLSCSLRGGGGLMKKEEKSGTGISLFILTSYFFVLLWLVSEKWPLRGIPVLHKFLHFSISLTGHYTKRQKINRGQSRERKMIRYAVELMFLHISWCQKNGNYVRDNFHFLALHEMWEKSASFLC